MKLVLSVVVCFVYLFFSFSLGQANRLNYHAISGFGHSGLYHGQNHLAEDLSNSIGWGLGFRYGINRFGILVQTQSMRHTIQDNSFFTINSKYASNRILSISPSFTTNINIGVLEPRLHVARQTTRYSRDYKNRNMLIGLGLKYGIPLGFDALCFIVSADYLFNLTRNISAPETLKSYMNNTRFMMFQFGLEWRLFDN